MKSAAAQITEPAQRASTKAKRRGSEKRKRQRGFFVRTLPEHEERLKIEAEAALMSVPAYLLSGRLGNDVVPVYRRRLPKIEERAIARNNAELNHIGSNYNQMTRGINQLLPIAREMGADRLERILTDVLELNRAVGADLTRTLAANRAALGYDSEM